MPQVQLIYSSNRSTSIYERCLWMTVMETAALFVFSDGIADDESIAGGS